MGSIATLLFGSETLPRVLLVLGEHVGRPLTAGQIASEMGEPNRDSLYRALGRGEAAGLIRRNRHGAISTFEIDSGSPIYPEVKLLVTKVVGAPGVLRRSLEGIEPPQVEQAFIYGSVARGEDRFDSDLDVFVVGTITSLDLATQLREVTKDLKRELNPVAYPREEIERRLTAGDPFMLQVWRQPKLILIGKESDLPMAGSAAGS